MFKSALGKSFRNQLAETIFRQKYAHSGCETWEELAKTLVEDVCQQYLSKEDKEQLVEYISEMKFIPGGRYLYYAGRLKKYFNNCLSGDTKFLTKEGIFTLREKVEQQVQILSPVSNDWETAQVQYFGDQQLNTITFANVRGKSNKTWTVRATSHHRWPLVNGEVVDNLKIGDYVASTFQTLDIPSSKEGETHGMVFADGNVHVLKSGFSHQLRLCGRKTIHRDHFSEDYVITYPQFANGDPVVYIKSERNLKELPTCNDPIEYIIGFIKGWIKLEAHFGNVFQIHSINKEVIEFFIKYAPYCGYVVSGKVCYTDAPSNFGERKPLYWVNFSNRFPGFKVISIEAGEIEDVYCVVEPKHKQFYLEHGIATGNCFLLTCLEDTRQDWANLSWKAESCLTTGGGIGSVYSVYRNRGSLLHSTGGYASGPVSKMKIINEIGREVMQGGSRRSAIWAGLHHWHPDIKEFLHAKDWRSMPVAGTDKTLADLKASDFNFPAPLDMTNISVLYDTDWLLKYWQTGDYGSIFLENCLQAMKTGEPGFAFNFFDKEKETLRNAPVSKNTWIYTTNGYVQVQNIVGVPVTVWTGVQWANTTFHRTRFNDKVVKVSFTGKRSIICSEDHPFILQNGQRINAIDLIPGQKLLRKTPEHIEGLEEEWAYILGFLYGDGSFHTLYPRAEVTLCGEKQKLIDKLSCNKSTIGNDSRGYTRIYYKNDILFANRFKNVFPEEVFTWGYKSRNDFLSGLIDSDGAISREYISIGSVHKEFLEGAARLADSLGLLAFINVGSKSGYTGNPTWSLRLSGPLSTLNTLRVRASDCNDRAYKVVSIEGAGTEDVYCCDVGVAEHSFMAEGIIISNCTEVTSEDDSDVCNLGSLNFGRITSMAELRDVTELATKFLICGTLRAELPYEAVYKTREKNRRLGLGLMGLHEWLLQRNEKYEVTEELHRWLTIYRDTSRDTANKYSALLSVSNPVACRAVAPTGSIGILAGTTTGIEPVYAVAIKRRYLKGTTWKYQYVIDGTTKELMDRYSVDPEAIESAMDLAKDFEKRIKFQAHIQDYVDMAISSTINLPAWDTEFNNEDLVKPFADTLAKYAHRLRGFTVYPDGSRGGQPLVSVPYNEAIDKIGVELEENTEVFDICDISGKGGSCGV